MPAITYDEDTEFGADLDEGDIAKCRDIPTLMGWWEDADAAIEDIKLQIEGAALGGTPERSWVYRASKAMGYLGRARSRCQSRMKALGWVQPAMTQKMTEMNLRFTELKARNAVAVEFLRLCQEGGFGDPVKFGALEKKAQALVAIRDQRVAERAATRAAAEEIAA